jgi:periplasmic protein TonB
MSPVARAGGVALSLVGHAGVAALLLALSAADWSHPLFVDLVERAESSGGPAAGAPGAPGPTARTWSRSVPSGSRTPESHGVAKATGPAVAPSAPRPPAPEAPTTPAPIAAARPAPLAEGMLPPEPPAPSPAAPAEDLSSPALVDPPRAPASHMPVTAPAPPAPPGRRGGPEAGPGARTEGESRGDAASSPGGAPGSPLALGSTGTGTGAVPAEYGPYLQRFRQRVVESLVYPLAARRQGLRGTVELDIRLDPGGRVRDVRVVHSSSHGLLDDAAVETVRRLGPLPFPESLPPRPLLIRLPLVFDLR